MIYYSVHFNRPDFISAQKQFIDGELVIINNHCNPEIEQECRELGIRYYNLENPYSRSYSHAYALNYLKTLIDYSDDYCIIDHDLFPYRKIEFNEYDIISVKATNNPEIPYLWPGFLAGRKSVRLDDINFEPNLIPNGDTGCDTHRLVEQLGIKIHYCIEKYIGDRINEYVQTSPIVSQFDDYCIHYLNGSNWLETDYAVLDKKNNLLIDLLNSIR